MKISGWGNYPKVEARVRNAGSVEKAREILKNADSLIPRGLGRSYGDSSLSKNIISTLKLNRMLLFDNKEGILSCESGVSLEEILALFVPRGWFLPVTPGTKFVTVGGAIASDVHGKNHHKDGSFSDHLISIDILTTDGSILTCSQSSNTDLFKATCGGMGLTGIILRASLKLIKIETAYIKQNTVKTRNLTETMDLFEQYRHVTYSVAWVDTLSKKDKLGRSIVMFGEHATFREIENASIALNPLILNAKRKIPIPVNFPNGMLNTVTARCFNFFYYHKSFHRTSESIVDYESFFYPLDSIHNWNRIYGSRGFTQYQCVLPYATSKEGLTKILNRISDSGIGSFLAVLKLFGKNNDNLLSFPMEGYTLALDFPVTAGLFTFLDELDEIVADSGGRLYLSKDARMSKSMFHRSYTNAARFNNVKQSIDKNNTFLSFQAKRLGI